MLKSSWSIPTFSLDTLIHGIRYTLFTPILLKPSMPLTTSFSKLSMLNLPIKSLLRNSSSSLLIPLVYYSPSLYTWCPVKRKSLVKGEIRHWREARAFTLLYFYYFRYLASYCSYFLLITFPPPSLACACYTQPTLNCLPLFHFHWTLFSYNPT